ncbi:MAG: erythromycin esterase family protein [Micromonosporaceae bacterium]|nr:erythromycin esterase family protein [Micromonosporaceae bacterium]
MGRHRDDVAALVTPLNDPSDLDPLLERTAGARVVMLGEASHGTHEFYTWRAAITRRLIVEQGFSFVAVEGDWPDCERVDWSVRGRTDAPADPAEALATFERWPRWMWANEEVAAFCRWLRQHNAGLGGRAGFDGAGRDESARVGFFGLDVYSLWESLREILLYLRDNDPPRVLDALAAYRCFESYGRDPQTYALATRLVPTGCENEVLDLLVGLRQRAAANGAGAFAAWQNAEVVAGAERYYRTLMRGGAESWNVRDQHMADTLARLLEYHGPSAKAVVWAHNTHVGDARGSDMAQANEVTLGQLARQRYGSDQVVLVGFGTYQGTVVASEAWGAPLRTITVPPARAGSLEDELHSAAPRQGLAIFDRYMYLPLLTDELDHRAIGVVYQPEVEAWGNYVPTVLGLRYDAFCWFDRSRELRPLPTAAASPLEPETYPYGV